MNNEQILSSIYYDPKNPGSFSSSQRLYKEAKKFNKNITLNVKD